MSRSKNVPTTATARLKQDYIRIKKDPVPYVIAEPLQSNILEWHYVVRGPEDTPYHGGIYHGKLAFPREFPFKPPAIYIITPNGRFKCNTKLCLSISDFHPDTWNPAWSVGTILTGLLSFMVETTMTLGSIETNHYTKQKYARHSGEFNLKDPIFCKLFPDIVKEIKEHLSESEKKDSTPEQSSNKKKSQPQKRTTATDNNENPNNPAFESLKLIVGIIFAGVIVSRLISSVSSAFSFK